MTADATNTSVSTVKRVLQKSKTSDFKVAFKTPGKKRQRIKPVTGIDNFDKGIIRRCIHNFHITEKELPTIDKLHVKLRSDINFQGSEKSLRSIIKELGFKWKQTENKRKILVESSAIRLLRINYLQKLKKYRQQDRPIIYSDELSIYSFHVNSKKSDGSTTGSKKPISKEQRVVIIHAGSETGFVPNGLLTFTSGTKSGDHHDDLNFENYEKWIRTQLLPNLPPKSVLVIDNASYHNKVYDSAPNSNSKKCDMHAWLSDKGISFTTEMLKPELYQLIKSNKIRFQRFIIDDILAEHGHEVLRLPSYHPDLNPIEMVWLSIKSYISSKNIQWNIGRVIELVKEKIDVMGPNDWKKLCDEVKTIEEAYINSDHVIDQMTDELDVRVGDSDDNSSSESDSSTDTDDVGPAPRSSSVTTPINDHDYERVITISDSD